MRARVLAVAVVLGGTVALGACKPKKTQWVEVTSDDAVVWENNLQGASPIARVPRGTLLPTTTPRSDPPPSFFAVTTDNGPGILYVKDARQVTPAGP